jgi:hypothetical protein
MKIKISAVVGQSFRRNSSKLMQIKLAGFCLCDGFFFNYYEAMPKNSNQI